MTSFHDGITPTRLPHRKQTLRKQQRSTMFLTTSSICRRTFAFLLLLLLSATLKKLFYNNQLVYKLSAYRMIYKFFIIKYCVNSLQNLCNKSLSYFTNNNNNGIADWSSDLNDYCGLIKWSEWLLRIDQSIQNNCKFLRIVVTLISEIFSRFAVTK